MTIPAMELLSVMEKLRLSSQDRNVCVIRPSEADAILSEFQRLQRIIEVGQRTALARKLAFEAAIMQGDNP